MEYIAHLVHHLWQLLVWWWSNRYSPQMGPVDQAGFLVAIIGAIIAIAVQIGQFVLDAGQLIFDSVVAAATFAARGVVWIVGILRKGFGELLDGLKNTFGAVDRWLGNLYCTFRDFIGRIEQILDPIIQFVKKVQAWFNLVWKRVVQPVLNLLQRMRKVLAIFKFFHLKWAQKLDSDLAWLEGKITKAFLTVRQWVNLVGSWVNFLVDPTGALKMFPLVAGFFAALNVTWTGLFGTKFQGAGGSGSRAGPSTAVTVTFGQTASDVQNGTGPAAVLQQRFAGRQTQFNSAGGLG